MIADDRVNAAVGAAAASNWFWLPYLHEGMSLLLTILGIVWLVVQIYYKVWRGR
jgi:hypothetical protein